MNEQEIARHAEQVENYRNHVFGKESNQLFAEVDMWIKGDKCLKKIREIFSDVKKPEVPTKSLMGYYDANEGDGAKQAVVSYRDKHRQNLSDNRQLEVIDEKEIKEFDQTIDQFEKKIAKLQETLSGPIMTHIEQLLPNPLTYYYVPIVKITGLMNTWVSSKKSKMWKKKPP